MNIIKLLIIQYFVLQYMATDIKTVATLCKNSLDKSQLTVPK